MCPPRVHFLLASDVLDNEIKGIFIIEKYLVVVVFKKARLNPDWEASDTPAEFIIVCSVVVQSSVP